MPVPLLVAGPTGFFGKLGVISGALGGVGRAIGGLFGKKKSPLDPGGHMHDTIERLLHTNQLAQARNHEFFQAVMTKYPDWWSWFPASERGFNVSPPKGVPPGAVKNFAAGAAGGTRPGTRDLGSTNQILMYVGIGVGIIILFLSSIFSRKRRR